MPIYTQYYFWLVAISVLCLALERVKPWRKQQPFRRRGLLQDFGWLIFNGHYLGLLLLIVSGPLVQVAVRGLVEMGLPDPRSAALLTESPFWLQIIVFLVIKDFIEWNIHRLLHNVPWLWEFHKLHHSIRTMDWIGNFRFHWGEVIVYKTLSYFPLIILGVDNHVILSIAIIGTLTQDLNHANLEIDWGPLRYLLNSPKMHVWHHDVEVHGRGGQNFGIVLSLWDWIFGTVYWPKNKERPKEFGFENMHEYPDSLFKRFTYPFLFKK